MEEEHSSRAMRSQSRDEGRLAELGYKQELKREWTLLHNFGVSFSIIVRVHGPFSTPCPVSHREVSHRSRFVNGSGSARRQWVILSKEVIEAAEVG